MQQGMGQGVVRRSVPLSVVQLDYQTTHDLIKMLTDLRFKLVAFVPALSTAGVVLVLSKDLGLSPLGMSAFGLSGFLLVLGVILYDLRNSELYNASMHRAKVLETVMGCVRDGSEIVEVPPPARSAPEQADPAARGDAVTPDAATHRGEAGGLHSQRAISFVRFLGLDVSHGSALSLVYGVLLGAWVFPIAKGLLVAAGMALHQLAGLATLSRGTGFSTSILAFLAAALCAYAFRRALEDADTPGVVTALYWPSGVKPLAEAAPSWKAPFMDYSHQRMAAPGKAKAAPKSAEPAPIKWTRRFYLVRHKLDFTFRQNFRSGRTDHQKQRQPQ